MDSPNQVDVVAAWNGWEQANLTQRIPHMLEQVQQMLQRIEQAKGRRKALAAETKRFRTAMDGIPDNVLLKLSSLIQS